MLKRKLKYLIFIIGFYSLTACSKKEVSQVSQSASVVSNEFSFPLSTDLVTLDPAKVQDEPTHRVLQHVYEGLVKLNEKNEVVPSLAERWDVSEDGRRYTFYLKKGVKFHNGKELDAEDVKYSIERACAKSFASPAAQNFFSDIVGVKDKLSGKAREISGVQVIDPERVEITIVKPRAYFLPKLAFLATAIVPKGGVSELEITKVEGSIGTGPYKLVGYIRNQEVLLKANSRYHGGKILVDTVKVPIIKESTTALNGYKAGKYSYYTVPGNDIKAVEKDPLLKHQLHSITIAATYFLELNPKSKPFNKKKVRQAIALAVDKKKIIDGPLEGTGEVAHVFLPPGMLGHRSNAKGLEFDIEKARQLLAQAGYPNGKGLPPLTITVPSGSLGAVRMATNIAIQLKSNLNIRVDVKQLEWSTLLAKMTAKQVPFLVGGWMSAYVDPANFLSDLFMTNAPQNHFNYSNSLFDRLCSEANSHRDPVERSKLYACAEDILLDDAVIIPLNYSKMYYLQREDIKGVPHNLIGMMPLTQLNIELQQ